jgi:hypothetical protein
MAGLPGVGQQKAIITEAANRYGVRPDVLWGLYGTETSFGHDLSTSSAGAVGPFQFEPSTAKGMGVNPYDFRSAAFGAAKYLSQYKGRGVGGALSAYNAGPAGGYQAGYVQKTLQNAKSYGGVPAGVKAPQPQQGTPGTPGLPGFKGTVPGSTNKGLMQLASLWGGDPLLKSLIESKAQVPASTVNVPGIPGTPGTTGGAPPVSTGAGKLGGFLPSNAELEVKRIDQGQDIRTNPGGPIIAPGDGEVIAVKSDPSGFGPNYPVVKFTTGHLAGTTWYIGHTHSDLKVGDHFHAGQALSQTGRGPGPVGNATVPGWAEIGLSSALGSGNMQAGQATVPYLRGRR